MDGPAVLTVSRRSLVLVAGIPGAGKSTMLRGLRAVAPDVRMLDSDPLRDRLGALLPARMPYRCYRPLVHLWHRLRIVATVFAVLGPVVVHLPATGALTRCAIAALALAACRRRYLVWVDVEPASARAGQLSRGRVLRKSCFDRHVRLGSAFARRLRAGHRPRGWNRIAVLDRERIRHGLVVTSASVA